jgi:hypothetical protein
MVEHKSNILKDKTIKRIIKYSDDQKQITILDQRFYKRNGNYYPSVSSILQYYPKGKYFEDWIKDTGHNAEIIAAKAATEGTQTHNAIDDYLNGKTIEWIDEYGNAKYSLEVWKMIIKFSEFWTQLKPKLITSEYHLFSDEYEYAGTADLILEINEELWLLDIKTSNSLHTSYSLQLAAYTKAWNETHDKKITRTGILWLKASTRKEGPMQGKGWQLKEISEIDKYFNIFCKIQDIFKLENPKLLPYSEMLPTSLKLEE